jgi:hypothetical protein
MIGRDIGPQFLKTAKIWKKVTAPPSQFDRGGSQNAQNIQPTGLLRAGGRFDK